MATPLVFRNSLLSYFMADSFLLDVIRPRSYPSADALEILFSLTIGFLSFDVVIFSTEIALPPPRTVDLFAGTGFEVEIGFIGH